jgi:RHS repeat-associated protein
MQALISVRAADTSTTLPLACLFSAASGHWSISTGKERDPESGLDDFGARYYASNLGRFMSPDWAAKPVTVPYASFGDPQTLNLYAYVENAPLNQVDADGHANQMMSMDETMAIGESTFNANGCGFSACPPSEEEEAGPGGYAESLYVAKYVAEVVWVSATTGNTAAQPAQEQVAQQNSGQQDQWDHNTVLVGTKKKEDLGKGPIPEPDDGGFWTVDWMPYHLNNGQLDGSLAAGCPECSTDPKIQVDLKESIGGKPYQDMGTKPGHGHDSFMTGGHGAAASTGDVNQHWYVNGKRVQVVMGVNQSTGKPILTWETHVSLQNSGPPVYSPVGSGDQ